MVFEGLLDIFDGNSQHVGIGQTALNFAVLALAVDEREVLGMGLIEVARDEVIEGVDEVGVSDFATGRGV